MTVGDPVTVSGVPLKFLDLAGFVVCSDGQHVHWVAFEALDKHLLVEIDCRAV